DPSSSSGANLHRKVLRQSSTAADTLGRFLQMVRSQRGFAGGSFQCQPGTGRSVPELLCSAADPVNVVPARETRGNGKCTQPARTGIPSLHGTGRSPPLPGPVGTCDPGWGSVYVLTGLYLWIEALSG